MFLRLLIYLLLQPHWALLAGTAVTFVVARLTSTKIARSVAATLVLAWVIARIWADYKERAFLRACAAAINAQWEREQDARAAAPPQPARRSARLRRSSAAAASN
jgi:hypothetical protein